MKILSFLFAIYFSALAVMPCGDEEAIADTCQTTTCIHIDNKHSQHSCDICSPLCMCSCCGGITLVSLTQFNFNLLQFTELNTFITHQKISSLPYSIWQPPKIS